MAASRRCTRSHVSSWGEVREFSRVLTIFNNICAQRGSWYTSGELSNSSKHIVKGYMEKNVKNRLIVFKTFTNVESYGENNAMNKNIENLITMAFWCACFHGNIKKNIENEIIILVRDGSRTVVFQNTENWKLKGCIP